MLKSNVGSVFFWRGGPESFEFDGLFSSRNAWYLQDFLLFGASHTSKVIFQNTPRNGGYLWHPTHSAWQLLQLET